MLSLYDVQELIGTGFFDGNLQIAGLVMYAMVLLVLFALTRNTVHTLIISIPATLIFSMLGVLPTDLMVLLIVITVIGLGISAKGIWRD